jgi:hypothetical protein
VNPKDYTIARIVGGFQIARPDGSIVNDMTFTVKEYKTQEAAEKAAEAYLDRLRGLFND